MSNPSRLVQEREHHDHFYEAESLRISESPLYNALDARMVDLLIRRGSMPGARVLSVGSGDGRLEVRAAPQVAEIVGYELSPIAVDRARIRATAAGTDNAHFEVGEIGNLALPAQSFDVVWAIAVLHHLSDEEIVSLVGWARRILTPGGLFVSIDPSTRRLVGLFRRLVARTYDQHHSPEERELDIRTVRQQFREAGFERIETYPSDYFASPLAWIVPTIPRAFVHGLMALDTLLMRIPVLRDYASSFMVVGRRPH
jgi:SAM-dependent methyltransferase